MSAEATRFFNQTARLTPSDRNFTIKLRKGSLKSRPAISQRRPVVHKTATTATMRIQCYIVKSCTSRTRRILTEIRQLKLATAPSFLEEW